MGRNKGKALHEIADADLRSASEWCLANGGEEKWADLLADMQSTIAARVEDRENN